MDLVDPALGHARPIVGVGRQRLLQLGLLDRKDFLNLGGGETYGVVSRAHTPISLSTPTSELATSGKWWHLQCMILSKEIEDQVFSLPLEERARLADRLLTSLESPADESWLDHLDSEVKARMEAAQRGEITTADGEAALGRMWNLLRQ